MMIAPELQVYESRYGWPFCDGDPLNGVDEDKSER